MSSISCEEEICWESRMWIPYDLTRDKTSFQKPYFRFISYNILSDYRNSFLTHSCLKNWEIRKNLLLKEILSYNSDIICLQDVDHYDDWWRPQLMNLGYDTIFKLKTSLKDFHNEGILIAYRRDVFQLFKSIKLELNDAIGNERGSHFKERCKTDDVVLIIFLQPWIKDSFQSAICVCCTMLSDITADSDVRMAHIQYIAHQIELANKDFHLPVIMGISMYDVPDSSPYITLRTGREPMAGQRPQKCQPPIGYATCRGSILLKWFPPKANPTDPPLTCYRLAWRPGGSSILSFKSQITIKLEDCVKYEERLDKFGQLRMTALVECQYILSGLVSDIPYEFRLVAVNNMGEGIWSDVSLPIIMNNPEKAEKLPELVNFQSLQELNQTCEYNQMQSSDWDVDKCYMDNIILPATQLTPRNSTLSGNPLSYISRTRVLPYHINPRDGWKDSLHGEKDANVIHEMNKESVVLKSILRDKNGFKNKLFNKFQEAEDMFLLEHSIKDSKSELVEDINIIPSNLINSNNLIDRIDDNEVESNVESTVNSDFKTKSEDDILSLCMDNQIDIKNTNDDLELKEKQQKEEIEYKLYIEKLRVQDKANVLLDSREVFEHIGIKNRRQLHDLILNSAYESYSVGGEPMFTASMPALRNKLGTECMDYIFYSTGWLQIRSLLSLPLLNELHKGESPQYCSMTDDINTMYPSYIMRSAFNTPINKLYQDLGINTSSQSNNHISQSDINEAKQLLKKALTKSYSVGSIITDDSKNSTSNDTSIPTKDSKPQIQLNSSRTNKNEQSLLWGGKWVPQIIPNTKRYNYWLPSESYASTHIALGVDLELDTQLISTQWSAM